MGALEDIATAAQLYGASQAGGLQVQAKTNYGPAFTIYQEAGAGGGGNAAAPGLIQQLLGLQWGIQITDASGNLLASYGAWPATDPVRVIAALGVVALLVYLLARR